MLRKIIEETWEILTLDDEKTASRNKKKKKRAVKHQKDNRTLSREKEVGHVHSSEEVKDNKTLTSEGA